MEYANKMGLGVGGMGQGDPAKVFLVYSGVASDVRDIGRRFGLDDVDGSTLVFATLDEAIGAAVASRCDKIYVAPGYTQTITGATALFDKAGIEIIGLGNGSLRPTLTYTTASAASVTVSASNIILRNFLCVANFASVAAPFTLTTADDFTLDNCEFRDTTAILNFLAVVKTSTTSNASDGIAITNCRRIGLGATTNTTIVNMLGTNDRLYIKNNYFNHQAVTAGGLMIIATGKVVTNAEIEDNMIHLVGAAALTTGIIITTDGTTNSGIIDGNKIWSLDDTSEILVTASSGFKFGVNYYSGTADKSGYVLPAADA